MRYIVHHSLVCFMVFDHGDNIASAVHQIHTVRDVSRCFGLRGRCANAPLRNSWSGWYVTPAMHSYPF
jgi:hypothetical protein